MTRRYTRKYQVVIGDKSTNVMVETEGQAIERAVTKLFGSRCFWFPDSGVPGYGQVFEALKPTKNNSDPGNSSVTGRVGIEVRTVGRPSVLFVWQQAADRKQEKIENEQYADFLDRERRAYDAGHSGLEFPSDLLEGDDSEWLKTKYSEGQHDAAEWVREQQERDADEKAQRDEWERAKRQQYMAEQYELALGEHRDRMAQAKKVAEKVAHVRSLSTTELLSDPTVQAIIRNTIAPLSFERIGRGKMGLGEFKQKMLAGEYMAEVTDFINSDFLYKRLENI